MSRTRRSAPQSLRALTSSSALGGSILLLAIASPTFAADECGAVTAQNTTATCTAAGGPYGRVTYDTPFSLNLQLEAGAVLDNGLDLRSSGVSIVVNGPDVDLASTGSTTVHIWDSSIADVSVTLGDVSHTGTNEAVFVSGVRSAALQFGDVTSSSKAVFVTAQGSANVTFGAATGQVENDDGDDAVVKVQGNSVRLTGGSVTSTNGDAVRVRGTWINLALDEVNATGEGGGVILSGSGQVVLDLGEVQTHGDGSTGVSTENASCARIEGEIGSITTRGDGSTGLYLYSDAVDLSVGAITTKGSDSIGVYVSGDDVTLDFGTVSTEGENSLGIGGYAADAFALSVGRVSTQGDYSTGVSILGDADITIDIEEVSTLGDSSIGIEADAQLGAGVVLVEARTVQTAGDDSTGVSVLANGSETTVNVGSVTTGRVTPDGTTGAGSHGVSIEAALKATVNADSILTRGADADAVRINSLPLADITVDVGTLTTYGDGSSGVYVDMGEPGDVAIDAETIATFGEDAYGIRVENGGGGQITVTESITTQGDRAFGIWAELRDVSQVEALTVSTQGDGATAVHIEGNSLLTLGLGGMTTAGDQAHGVNVRGVLVQGAIDGVTTAGQGAMGIQASASDGVNLEIGRVRTAGDGSVGVSLTASSESIVTGISDVETTGDQAHGVLLDASRDITATIGRIVVAGQGAHGLVAHSDFDQTLTVEAGVTAEHGAAIDLTGSRVDFTLEQGGVVRGGEVGLRIDAWNGSHVILDGSVSASHGPALDIKGGATHIENRANTIVGHIDLTDNNDVLDNAGRFTAGGLSDFGLGDDELNNTGLINLVEGTTPRTATFVNLETLNNAGVIDLANGVAGDIFTIDGVLNGLAGNSIELDLDLRGAPLADRIVAGSFEGLSNILLTVQGRAALGETGIVIAQSGSAQDGDEIDVAVAGGGFVEFDLVYANGAYRLTGDLAPPAFEPTKVASGAQHQWTSGADVVSARFDQMRDEGSRTEGRGDQVWTQVYGGSNDIEAKRGFDLFGESIDADLSHEVKSQGLQAGVDRAVPVENGSLVFGMLAGAGKTELRFQNGDVTEYDGVGVGAYGHWFSGPLSIGVLAKLDTFKLDYDWGEANLKTRSDGFTVGARVDAAWRIAMGPAWHVEPQASISWSDTALGRMKARDGAEVVFGDTRSVVGRIGVRAGGEMALDNGLSLKPFAAVHALNEFEGDNASTLILGDEAVAVADRAHGAWGRAVLGASVEAPSGLGAFIQAEGDFGEVEGFTARAGIKFSW